MRGRGRQKSPVVCFGGAFGALEHSEHTASQASPGTVIAVDAARSPVLGSLAETRSSDVIGQLVEERRTGVLKVGETAPSWAAFSEGSLVVAGSVTGPSLRDLITSAGLVDHQVLHGISQRAGSHDLQLLAELVEQVDPWTLEPLLRERCVAVLFEMLLPSREPYAFLPGDPLGLAAHFSFPTLELLAEAQHRVEDWARIAAAIPSTQVTFRPRRRLAPDIAEVQLDRDQWAVLAVLDGRRTVSQTIAAIGRPAYDVCSVIHQLLQQGLIERAS